MFNNTLIWFQFYGFKNSFKLQIVMGFFGGMDAGFFFIVKDKLLEEAVHIN